MEDREPDITIVETYLKRTREAVELGGTTYDGATWWWVIVPVLILAAFFVGWMYLKDSRSIRWYFAFPLALLRCTVYALLTYMFLLHTRQETRIWLPRTPPPLQKTTRVVVLIDVSDSMALVSDDLRVPAGSSGKTRLQKVVEYLSDSNAEFMKKLLAKNPVYVYRFATRLDSEVYSFMNDEETLSNGVKTKSVRPFIKLRNEKDPNLEDVVKFAPWEEKDWVNFATYTDFKLWLLKGLSPEGRKKVQDSLGAEPGGVEWADDYMAKDDAEAVDKLKLSENDARLLKGNRFNLRSRISLARSITQGTNLVDSVKAAFEGEKDNKLEGIIVFSDGRSNSGEARSGEAKGERRSNPELEKLHLVAKKASIPIITVGIGEERTSKIKLVRITDLQAPDQTPPDDAFKINLEVDGEHMPGETKDVVLEFRPPDTDASFELPGKVTFDRSDPPHGQFEWTINPADLAGKIPEDLLAKVMNGKELVSGIWKVRGRMKKVNEEGRDDPKENIFSEVTQIRIEKKPARILLMCNAPNRDFQFLLTQLIRDRADLSVYVQNEAGRFLEGKSITYLDDKFRHLKEFPNKLIVEDDPSETQETRWLNLARYDVIIAFDPDWSLLTEEQAKLLQTWVDLQAGGLLHVAGPVQTKKLTYPENAEKLAPLLEIFPVILGDYDLKMANRDRRDPRRLEFPGVAPEMEFLRLDDDKPEELLSGWEPFFTGKEGREDGANLSLKRGFFDYYPIKDIKAGATVVARYMEPLANENTFDKKEPPYIVAYKYGQGMTALLGSSEIWRFNQYKSVYFQRFWVKMARFLSSGSRKKQTHRGRVLMSKEFSSGDYIRIRAELLDPNLQGLPASAQPDITLRPVELDSYEGMNPDKKKDGKDAPAPKKDDGFGDPDRIAKDKEDYHKRLTRAYKMTARKGEEQAKEGGFEFKKLLAGKEFPTGVWRVDVPIPNSGETLSQKFLIRKSLPIEMSEIGPDFYSLAAVSAEVEEVKSKLVKQQKQGVFDELSARAFVAPGLNKPRMMYKFDDKRSLELIPDCMDKDVQEIENPQTEPKIIRTKIEALWFDGPEAPRWSTRWYDDMMDQPEKTHTVALWMLACIALLSVEWLTRKLLKLA